MQLGGLAVTLYVTLTTPGTSLMMRSAIPRRVANGSSVGVAATASVLSQHRTSISRLNSRYSAGTANKSDYRRQIDAMEEDREAIRKLVAENRRTVTAIQSDINAIGGVRGAALVQDRDRLIEQRLILQQQMAILQRLMDDASAIG